MARTRREPNSRTDELVRIVGGIELQFGVGALQMLGDVPQTSIDALPTGVDVLDAVLGIGGWRRGLSCCTRWPRHM